MSTVTPHPVPVTAVAAKGDSQELCQEIYLTELTAAQYLARLRHHQQSYERARLRNRDASSFHGGTSGKGWHQRTVYGGGKIFAESAVPTVTLA